ncbi:hypothetical protein ACFYRY_37830 [Streptomyces sp. NPDC005263]
MIADLDSGGIPAMMMHNIESRRHYNPGSKKADIKIRLGEV